MPKSIPPAEHGDPYYGPQDADEVFTRFQRRPRRRLWPRVVLNQFVTVHIAAEQPDSDPIPEAVVLVHREAGTSLGVVVLSCEDSIYSVAYTPTGEELWTRGIEVCPPYEWPSGIRQAIERAIAEAF